MSGTRGARRRIGLSSAVAVTAVVLGAIAPRPAVPADRRPNVVIVLTDDQTFDTLPHDPPVMPFLQGRMQDPGDRWIRFPNAFIDTPLCCPSRATILTGRYSHHTGVRNNSQAFRLDEGATVATWLHAAGYTTGLFGKYLNRYPFGGAPSVPPGWDRWGAKIQGSGASVYYDYVVSRQGFPVAYDQGTADYSTDVFAGMAVDFIRTAPTDRPFFLLFSPTGPHPPWTPAPREAGSWTGPVTRPPSLGEADVSDKPAWVRALPPFTAEASAAALEDRRREYETLRAVDDAVRDIVGALRARGALEDTVIFYLTDNGDAIGEHRWMRKSCPYDACIRTPFLARVPGAERRTDDHLVSNVDLAPTIADLAGIEPPDPVDGASLVPLLGGQEPTAWRSGVLSEFVGDGQIPAWWEIRTADAALIEYATGERELYDLTGVVGPADPFELENRAGQAPYARLEGELSSRLDRLRPG